MFILWKLMELLKSLMIEKGQSEYASLRRTDNTMAKRKRTNNDQQNTTLDRELKTEQHESIHLPAQANLLDTTLCDKICQ